MKNLILLFAAATISFASCNSTATNDKKIDKDSTATATNFFGKQFENNNAIAVSGAVAQINAGKEFKGIVEGRIMDVCQAKGCWANLELPAGQTIKVLFRDANGDEFGIDKNSKGKMIDVNGIGYMDTTSVEMLKHYAEDEGASKEEIAKIKTPEIKPVFNASGAFIKQ
jgi:hypothetical protein